MSAHIPRLAGFTLLLDALHAIVGRLECGWGGHDWFTNPENGAQFCRCCLGPRRR
jgi:hypothetical protein